MHKSSFEYRWQDKIEATARKREIFLEKERRVEHKRTRIP